MVPLIKRYLIKKHLLFQENTNTLQPIQTTVTLRILISFPAYYYLLKIQGKVNKQISVKINIFTEKNVFTVTELEINTTNQHAKYESSEFNRSQDEERKPCFHCFLQQ